MKKSWLKQKIQLRLKEFSGNVFLRQDFSDLGGYAQVGRALAGIVEDGYLARLGKGLYAKSQPSNFRKGGIVLCAAGGFKEAAREALDRLEVPWRPSDAEEKYNAGRTGQVPFNAGVTVLRKFSRKIKWRNFELTYDVKIPPEEPTGSKT